MSVKNVGDQGIWNSEKENEDIRNIKYAYEIINFRNEMNKLFERYNLNLKYSDSPSEAAKRIIISALNKKRYDVIEKISTDFPDAVRELMENPENERKLKNKLKKYKNLTNIFIAITVIMAILVIALALKGGII